MTNRYHVLSDTLFVEDIHKILTYCSVQKMGRVIGLGYRSSVAEEVGDDQPISLGLEIVYLVVPVKRRRGESVDKQESRLSGKWSGEEIVVLEVPPGFLRLRFHLVHGSDLDDDWVQRGLGGTLNSLCGCPIGCVV